MVSIPADYWKKKKREKTKKHVPKPKISNKPVESDDDYDEIEVTVESDDDYDELEVTVESDSDDIDEDLEDDGDETECVQDLLLADEFAKMVLGKVEAELPHVTCM